MTNYEWMFNNYMEQAINQGEAVRSRGSVVFFNNSGWYFFNEAAECFGGTVAPISRNSAGVATMWECRATVLNENGEEVEVSFYFTHNRPYTE